MDKNITFINEQLEELRLLLDGTHKSTKTSFIAGAIFGFMTLLKIGAVNEDHADSVAILSIILEKTASGDSPEAIEAYLRTL